jgi:hypothetical protein
MGSNQKDRDDATEKFGFDEKPEESYVKNLC